MEQSKVKFKRGDLLKYTSDSRDKIRQMIKELELSVKLLRAMAKYNNIGMYNDAAKELEVALETMKTEIQPKARKINGELVEYTEKTNKHFSSL